MRRRRFISQRAVADEVVNNPDPFPRQGSVSTMRSTWSSHSDFMADLISFALWPGNRPTGYDNEIAAGAERLLEDPDVAQAVHDMAYLAVSDVASTTFRLGHVAMSAAEGDKTISDAIAGGYEGLEDPWREVYAAFMEAWDLRLRPGITIDDIVNLLSVMVDGLTLRALGDPSSALIDHDRKRTLLGTAALALIYSAVEPAQNASGLTLEQAVHEMICGGRDSRDPAS